jgi:hypothetical protein
LRQSKENKKAASNYAHGFCFFINHWIIKSDRLIVFQARLRRGELLHDVPLGLFRAASAWRRTAIELRDKTGLVRAVMRAIYVSSIDGRFSKSKVGANFCGEFAPTFCFPGI